MLKKTMDAVLNHTFQMWFHGIAFVVFTLLIYPSLTTWKDSVPYLVFLSVYANMVGHMSGFGAAHAGREAEEEGK